MSTLITFTVESRNSYRTAIVSLLIILCHGPLTDALADTNWGIVRSGTWLLDTDRDPASEIDLNLGLPEDVMVAGDWDSDCFQEVAAVKFQPADGEEAASACCSPALKMTNTATQ